MFYRELVARFAHHLSVVWNLGEENTNTDAQRKAFGEYLHRIDPYDNPVVLHTFPKQQKKAYEPLLGFPYLEGVSLQTNDTVNQTREWIARSAAAGRPWVVCLDEIGPADTGVKPDWDDFQHNEVRTQHLWPHFMCGGAGVEWLFGYKYAHDDTNLEDFRSRDHMWDLTRYAVEFFEQHLPFVEMEDAHKLTPREDDFCLAKAGSVYALYVPTAERGTELELPEGTFKVRWYNPRKGGKLSSGSVKEVSGPGHVSLGTPPGDEKLDWACVVER